MEDNFSMDGVEDGSGGNATDGERWGAADETSLALPAAHLLLCGPVLNRPWTGTGWGLGTPVLNQKTRDPKP